MPLYQSPHKALGEHQYAIIDKMLSPELIDPYPTLDIVSVHLQPQAHLYPALLSVNTLPAEDWSRFTTELNQQESYTSPPRCQLLIESELPAKALCDELARALLLTDTKQRSWLLRYYDPRVLFHLSWMLTPWQLKTVLKAHAAPSWTYWLENQWHTLHFSDAIHYQKNDPTDLPIDKINRIGLINQLLHKLPQIALWEERVTTSQNIDVSLQQAAMCGLVDAQDVLTFAWQALTYHCLFWQHIDIQALLYKAKVNPGYYDRATRGWDKHDWEKIQSTTPPWILHKGIHS
ncbi:DUF4123 domain-containing protein [Providencia sp. PROV202]|uniref:DUF4123 domain-containing protein n=1 Tax=Providencia sp. PROV202 TaxID=2949902 RepID=UPI0023491E93|nr:DUF4123 domain-containing protein [Providencia sp. PROV202]